MTTPLHLFEGFGIELEYMLVDVNTLDVLPMSDRVLHAVTGTYEPEVEMGDIAWSNELVLHVIELKTNGPAPSLLGLPSAFTAQVGHINRLLAPLQGCLMPSAMHPWMQPQREMRLWPHAYSPVYEAFNRIFSCQGHGWANLQSVHLNLPFADDAEFGRLHAAIRLLLPIMPALAASSPIVEGSSSGFLDTRMEMYRSNAKRIPSVSGKVIPELAFTKHDYEQTILQPLYRDIAPHDPEGILQDEWLNARGAIARFDRSAIEIRVLDVQECPLADLAICAAIIEVLKALMAERWCTLQSQQAWPVEPLYTLLLQTIQHGEQAVITDGEYLRAFGCPDVARITAGEFWQYLCDQTHMTQGDTPWAVPLQTILHQGPLARRLLRALGTTPTPHRLQTVYRTLCDCLATGTMFTDGVS